jgi:NDP-sugar pyrophosphorylase family protein
MGAYAFRRDTVRLNIPAGTRKDMPTLLLERIAAGDRIATCLHEGFWLDIGRPEDYGRAQDLYESNPALFLGEQE